MATRVAATQSGERGVVVVYDLKYKGGWGGGSSGVVNMNGYELCGNLTLSGVNVMGSSR